MSLHYSRLIDEISVQFIINPCLRQSDHLSDNIINSLFTHKAAKYS